MIIKVNAALSGVTVSVPGMVQAENYINMSGIQTEDTGDADGGRNVGWIDNGDWMDYNINAATVDPIRLTSGLQRRIPPSGSSFGNQTEQYCQQ